MLEGEIADYMIETCGLALPAGLAQAVYPEQESSRCPAWLRIGSPVDPAFRDYAPIAIPCSKSTYEEGGWEVCR